MSNSIVPAGSVILNDNWALQCIAGLLKGEDDPSEDWTLVLASPSGPYEGKIKAGVFQIECLVTLLEQLMFAEKIYVFDGWQKHWLGKTGELDLLYSENNDNIICPVKYNTEDVAKTKPKWLRYLLRLPGISELYKNGMEKFRKDESDYWSQVINGVADYITMCQLLDCTYSPHPARTGFLKSTIWNVPTGFDWPTQGIRNLHTLIDRKRLKIMEKLGFDNSTIKLASYFPSSALLCLAESNNSLSPIQVALQLRNNDEIKELRNTLHQLTLAMISNNMLQTLEIANLFEFALNKACQKLSIPKSLGGSDHEENIMLDIFNVATLKTAENSEIVMKDISHSGIITRLVNTSALFVPKILQKTLKIDDSQVYEQLILWHNNKFISEINNYKQNRPIIIKEVKVQNNININAPSNVAIDNSSINNSPINMNNIRVNDFEILFNELIKLHEVLKKMAISEDNKKSCEAILEAQKAAKENNSQKLKSALKKAGKWAFENATKIGVDLTTAIFKSELGI